MKILYAIFLIILGTMLIYANSLPNPFIWDDIPLIVENPYIKNMGNVLKIFTSELFHFSYGKSNYYRPIQTITNMFDYSIWRLNPLGYHITNILLHSIVVYLIYTILNLITKNKRLSLITSLFFLVHPIHTEVVTYIPGRADSLVALFFLLCLLFYIKYKTSFKIKLYYYIFSIICFIFALLSKEIAIALPFTIVLYDCYFTEDRKINIKHRMFSYLPYFLVLGIYAFLRTSILNFSSRPILNIQIDSLLRVITSIKATIIYIGLILFPFNLHMERTLPIVNSVWELSAIIPVVLLLLIIIFTIRLHKSYKLISFGSAWFLLNLIPVSGIFMPGRNVPMFEHWLYLPSIGFFLILGAVFNKLININKKTMVIILALILLFYSYLTIRQNTTWKDPMEFYKRSVLFLPNNSKAHFNLALIYEQKDEYDKAIKEYKRTQEIDPNYFLVHNNLGNVFISKGLYDLAMQEYRRALEIEPNYFLTYNNLGNLYALGKEYNKAIEQYKKSVELNPHYSESHNNLGFVYLEINNLEDAENELMQALNLNPENAEAHNNLGNLYAKKNLYDGAIKEYKKAIKLKADLDKAHFNLGVVYFQKGLISEAKEEWEETLKVNPNHPAALNNLELLKGR